MEEEGQRDVSRQVLADVAGREHQVVVVDPDEPGAIGVLADGFGEAIVHRLVRLVVAALEARAIGHRMQQGPEGAVGEPVVVAGDLRLVEQDRRDLVGVDRLWQVLALANLRARPADPRAAPLAQHRLHGRDETPR